MSDIESSAGSVRKVMVGCRILPSVHEELARTRQATGKTESEIVAEAIAHYLGIATESAVVDRLTALERKVEAMVDNPPTEPGARARLTRAEAYDLAVARGYKKRIESLVGDGDRGLLEPFGIGIAEMADRQRGSGAANYWDLW